MSAPDPTALEKLIERFPGRRIAVLGDCMVDRYLWGHVDRISPEAPVPVVEIERESATLGGAGNVAANLRTLGAEPVLLGVVGEDAEGAALRASFADRGIATGGLIADPGR